MQTVLVADPNQYKLHAFRHAFASMSTRNNISYKHALEWTGHKSPEILDLCYKMYNDVAEQAIRTITYITGRRDSEAPAA